MGYRGRFQLGEEVPLWVQVYEGTNGTSKPAANPDMAVSCSVFSSTGKLVEFLLPRQDSGAVTGLFGKRIYLGASYAVGIYRVHYGWTVSHMPFAKVDYFQVVPGGSADGAVIAMQEFVKPPNRFFVQQLDSGKIIRGKNPRLA